jgi:hypothetical protein
MCSLGSNLAGAFDGRVIDGSTGKPIADAWVLGHWEAGGGLFGGGGGGCVLAVTRTNQKGEFSLVSGEGFFGRLFGAKERPNIDFLKPGYRARYPEPGADTQPFVLVADERPYRERLDALLKMRANSDCGEDYSFRHRKTLVPLYREMLAAAMLIPEESILKYSVLNDIRMATRAAETDPEEFRQREYERRMKEKGSK